MLEAIRAIYKVNLGVKKTERVLVFTDKPSKKETVPPQDIERRQRLRDIARLVAETGRGLAREIIYTEYTATGAHAKEPPVRLYELAFGKRAIEAFKTKGLLKPILGKTASDAQIKEAKVIASRYKKDSVDCVIALSNYSTSHTIFRKLLTNACGTRYASMPLFEAEMLEGAMNVNWKALEKRTKLIAREISTADAIEVSTAEGTHLWLSKQGRRTHADTGNLRKPGSFGNLPAGEVFFAPLEGTAKGEIVLRWAPTRELRAPVTLTVANGVVTAVEGEEEFVAELRAKLSERKENSNIAELGIGTNEMAKRPDNILESEKILGTIHIALGDNSTFGGKVKTPFHQDFVLFRPTLWLIRGGDRSLLMKDGIFREGIV